jgi:hypothetical protein
MILACVAQITVGKIDIEIYMKPVVVLIYNPATQTGPPSPVASVPVDGKASAGEEPFDAALVRKHAAPHEGSAAPAGNARGLTMETDAKKIAREGKWWYTRKQMMVYWFADKR